MSLAIVSLVQIVQIVHYAIRPLCHRLIIAKDIFPDAVYNEFYLAGFADRRAYYGATLDCGTILYYVEAGRVAEH